jgi:cell division protein FtsI/penicillin-binding protein 2
MRQSMVFRIRFITGAILFLALLLITRLYYLQVVKNDFYSQKAEKQYVHTKEQLFSRGSIYFTTKEGEKVSAASIRSGFELAFNPSIITDAKSMCTKLVPLLDNGLTTERCEDRATLKGRTYVEIDPSVNEEMAASIKELDQDGVGLYRSQWRYYPGGSLSARSIGFIGYTDEDDELHGKYGLERQYDDILLKEREVRSVNFFAEIFSNLGDLVYRKNKPEQGDIVTTIEPTVARMLDTVLLKTNDKYHSNLTGAVIMDPQTGAIYALNAVPGFDLNDRGTTTVEQFRNPLVEDVYEFGSTIKALTMAAGLDSGVINRHSTYYDAGSLTLDTFTIRNYDGRGRGTVEMQEVLNQSLNTGVSHIVSLMGKERFRSYFLKYGLGTKTGIDLPGEISGLVQNLNSPRDVEYATASFGQGIAMTPVAAARALAVLGNGGYLVTPHLVSEIRYSDGTSKVLNYGKGESVISEDSSEEVSRMLTTVVDVALGHGKYALPNHTIGAKTGTAQIADPNGGGYYEDKYLHSFFGYFPVFNPRFIVFMYTVDPKGVQYASETLTEPFMEITRFLINYYNIPPDR